MKFKNKLISSKFQKRYKRFFTDVESKGKTLISHCANSGSMLGLLNKDNKAWVSPADNPDRKLKYTLEIINDKRSNVGVNTHLANRIVEEAIEKKMIKEIKSYTGYQREVKFGLHSRFDFELKNKTKKAFLEVKNVTLSREKGVAEFPDAVTSRGLKHLEELGKAINEGYESYLIYLVQREDCKKFEIAVDIDPEYSKLLSKAVKKKLNILCYDCKFSLKGIKLNNKIKYII